MAIGFNNMINMQQQMMQQQQQMQAYSQMYGGGINSGGPGFIGGQSNPTGLQGNIADAHVGGGQTNWRGGLFPSFQPTEGYALDFNRNGRYDRGRDGVLVFDLNRDGKYDKKDVQNTNNMMQSVTGNFDFNNDGKVSLGERINGSVLRAKYQKLDTNRDGVLSQQEMSAGGGRVWVDSSRGGGVSNNELHSVNNIPNGGFFGRKNQELDFVNPFNRTSHTSSNQSPWGNGGGLGPVGGGWNPAGTGGWGTGGWNSGGMGPVGGGWNPWGNGGGFPSYQTNQMGYGY